MHMIKKYKLQLQGLQFSIHIYSLGPPPQVLYDVLLTLLHFKTVPLQMYVWGRSMCVFGISLTINPHPTTFINAL